MHKRIRRNKIEKSTSSRPPDVTGAHRHHNTNIATHLEVEIVLYNSYSTPQVKN